MPKTTSAIGKPIAALKNSIAALKFSIAALKIDSLLAFRSISPILQIFAFYCSKNAKEIVRLSYIELRKSAKAAKAMRKAAARSFFLPVSSFWRAYIVHIHTLTPRTFPLTLPLGMLIAHPCNCKLLQSKYFKLRIFLKY